MAKVLYKVIVGNLSTVFRNCQIICCHINPILPVYYQFDKLNRFYNLIETSLHTCVPMQRTANLTVLEHRSMMRTLEGKVSKQREMTGHSFSITSKHGCSIPAGAEEGATNLQELSTFMDLVKTRGKCLEWQQFRS